MGDRRRIYENLEDLAAKESVRMLLDGLAEGDGRRHGVYAMNRFVNLRSQRRAR
jgi:hypothetical protein